jgi:Raf kinase inhibitor-like YbhB/YbcL family protein
MITEISTLHIESPVFVNNGYMPSKYTCEGESISPPLIIHELPENTKTLAIIAEDPDAPNGTFDHWVVWNIKPKHEIPENMKNEGVQGKNGKQKTGYHPPCPPSGVHRYFFKIYALDSFLKLTEGADKKSLLDAMHGHILAGGEIMGLYILKN